MERLRYYALVMLIALATRMAMEKLSDWYENYRLAAAITQEKKLVDKSRVNKEEIIVTRDTNVLEALNFQKAALPSTYWWYSTDPSVIGVERGMLRPVWDGEANVCEQPNLYTIEPRHCWLVRVKLQ